MVVDFLDPLLATEVLLLEVVDILSGLRDRRRCIDVTVSSAIEQIGVQLNSDGDFTPEKTSDPVL